MDLEFIKNEPAISLDVQEIADKVSAKIKDFDKRIKTIKSITDKKDKIIKDLIRYTFVFDFNNYTSKIKETIKMFEDYSYDLVELKNHWVTNKMYKGVNLTFISKSYQLFEIQIHTIESLEAKNKTHDIYKNINATKEEFLWCENLVRQVEIPENIACIGNMKNEKLLMQGNSEYYSIEDISNISLDIAVNAHKGQKDKGGNDYILHPITIANQLEQFQEKAVAYLHDIFEDTNVTEKDLLTKGIPYKMIKQVRILTRGNESYSKYIKRIASSDYVETKKIKILDMQHNMDISRIKNPTKNDFDRVKKYKKNLKILEEAINERAK